MKAKKGLPLLFLLLFLLSGNPTERGGKAVLGTKEWVYFPAIDLTLEARVDTGAALSSLHGSDISFFEREGQPWVGFYMDHPAGKGGYYELPLDGYARVQRSSGPQAERRPVVVLDIRLGDTLLTGKFTLSNRSKMVFPVLLGRETLMGKFLVDVEYEYTRGLSQ